MTLATSVVVSVGAEVWCAEHAPSRYAVPGYPYRAMGHRPDGAPVLLKPKPEPIPPISVAARLAVDAEERLTPREVRLMVALFGCIALGAALKAILDALVH